MALQPLREDLFPANNDFSGELVLNNISSSFSSGSQEAGQVEIEAALENKLAIYLKYLDLSPIFKKSRGDAVLQNAGSLNYENLAIAVTRYAGNHGVLVKINCLYRWVFAEDRYFLATNQVLGRGHFATVYRGFTLAGEPCAIKMGVIKPTEISSLKKFKFCLPAQSNINRIIASDLTFLNRKQAVIILELADVSLSKASELNLTEKQKRIMIRGILSGLRQMTNKKIIHSDLKADNIFLMKREDYFAVKIGDFGLSVPDWNLALAGTPVFHPPEFFRRYAKNEPFVLNHMGKVDMWTAMLIFGEFAQDLLSPGFRERFVDYLSMIKQAEDEAKGQQRVFYCKMDGLLSQRLPGCSGLFSDLKAQTPLDRLMQGLSVFVPRDRVSAHEAIGLYDGFFTARPPEAFDFRFEELEEIEESNSLADEESEQPADSDGESEAAPELFTNFPI